VGGDQPCRGGVSQEGGARSRWKSSGGMIQPYGRSDNSVRGRRLDAPRQTQPASVRPRLTVGRSSANRITHANDRASGPCAGCSGLVVRPRRDVLPIGREDGNGVPHAFRRSISAGHATCSPRRDQFLEPVSAQSGDVRRAGQRGEHDVDIWPHVRPSSHELPGVATYAAGFARRRDGRRKRSLTASVTLRRLSAAATLALPIRRPPAPRDTRSSA
jgi:hypothetical protein